MAHNNKLQCFNRGCGQTYDPSENNDESCCYHPGAPFFHDAYKEWTCCRQKSVDFTEFLNFPGCVKSKHTNVEPAEPKKKSPVKITESPKETRKPVQKDFSRPPYDTALIQITPTVNENLKIAIDSIKTKEFTDDKNDVNNGKIPIGRTCYNSGCNYAYEGPDAEVTNCTHHPGVPIFHEGLKFWSCCQRRTTDFLVFMSQKGCTVGQHKWFEDHKELTCRYDWHQTETEVTVAIYAKMYHYATSTVKVNPVRLNVKLMFPEKNNESFNLDLELQGVIKPEGVTVSMFGSKVEIEMPKAEPGNWSGLEIPKSKPKEEEKTNETEEADSDVDLDDVVPISSGKFIYNL